MLAWGGRSIQYTNNSQNFTSHLKVTSWLINMPNIPSNFFPLGGILLSKRKASCGDSCPPCPVLLRSITLDPLVVVDEVKTSSTPRVKRDHPSKGKAKFIFQPSIFRGNLSLLRDDPHLSSKHPTIPVILGERASI